MLTSTRSTCALPALALLLLALAWAVWSTTPPSALPANIPATAFSATRAMATVRMVADRPHPTGSPDAAAVRARIAERLRTMGLSVTVLRGVGAGFSTRGETPTAQAGAVETLVATLPGTDRTLPAVAIMAHTDSVPDSHGAADDGFGVATALEAARAIAAGPRPVRDLVLILTDGEEAGLLGAHLFFADSKRAARIGALVNVDARGTAGLGTMFETGPGSGGLVAAYRATATNRFAHSAATFLYHQLPNRTDMTAALSKDVPALNFAFLDGEFDYHTPRDRLASVDPRTLQSLGDQVLPVVRAVAAARTLPARGTDGVFADVPGLVSVRYPAWVGWLLLALAALLAAWGLRGARLAAAGRGAVALLWIGIAAALAARAGYALTGVGDDWGEHHRIMAHALRYEAALGLVALAAVLLGAAGLRHGRRGPFATGCLLAGAVAILLGRPPLASAVLALIAAMLAAVAFARPLDRRDLRAGLVAVGLVASLVAQALAPALTPVFLWPTLAGALSAAVAHRWPSGPWAEAAIGLPPLAYVAVFGHAVLLALGIPTPEAIGLFAAIGAMLVLPLAGSLSILALPLVLIAAALFLSFRLSAASERFPALSRIHPVRDEAGRSWRMSPLERPDAWTAYAIGPGRQRVRVPILSNDPVWRAPAAAIPVTPPTISLARRGAIVVLTVTPASGGRDLRVRIAIDHGAADTMVEGVALPGFMARPGSWRLRWSSPGRPVTLRFAAPPATAIRVLAAETSERRLPMPPRPMTVVPWQGSDRIVAMAALVRTL